MSEPHTPGEWEAIPPKKTGRHWKVGTRLEPGDPRLFLLASIGNGAPGDSLDTEEANARLFAAAKEGLELLAELRRWHAEGNAGPLPDTLFDDNRTWKQAVEDYFAKVEGAAS